MLAKAREYWLLACVMADWTRVHVMADWTRVHEKDQTWWVESANESLALAMDHWWLGQA